MSPTTTEREPTLDDIRRCFEGAVPAVIATASAEGAPNITYLSRVQMVDAERIALSNQFFSKTARNLAENPRASVIVVDPSSYDQYRMTVIYERTERRGPVFERLRDDIAALAALEGMEDVFKLRSADIYRVLHLEQLPCAAAPIEDDTSGPADVSPQLDALATLASRMGRAADLDTLLSAAVHGLAELFDYEHSLLLLLDEDGRRLYTIASHGYDDEGVGSEVVVGEGLIGMAAARAQPLRIGNLHQMERYSRTVRRSFERAGDLAPAQEIAVPGLPDAQSRIAVPAMSFGQLVGVVMVESHRPVAFTAQDQAVLTVVASLIAGAVESERSAASSPDSADPAALADLTGVEASAAPPAAAGEGATRVRFFAADGSTFLDGDYLIKGVAGRILWSLLGQHERDGRVDFTNREVRLDPSLDLPPFRDNFENRLILLKRRLDEREAPIRIEKTGRGRFRLRVDRPVQLELGHASP